MTGFSGKVSAEYESKEDSIRLTKEQALKLVPSEGLGELMGKPLIQLDDDERGTSYQEFKNAAQGTVTSNNLAICASVSKPEAISLLCRDLLVDTMTGVAHVLASRSSELRLSLALSLPCATQ